MGCLVSDKKGGIFSKKRYRPEDAGWGRGRRPVINVSWDDVQAYIKWLNDKTGRTYRLPTEAEWEYACRSGTETAYSFGNSISKQQAQFSEGRWGSAKHSVEVGSFPPNDFGLYDMHGNVYEWVQDRYGDYKNSPQTDPQRRNTAWRVSRGGCWYNHGVHMRSASRHDNSPDLRRPNFGFRLARDL